MKTDKRVSSVGILALSGIFAKILGGIYRIPLTNLLGAEGIGLYQLVFPLYALLVAATTTAMPILMSRAVAGESEEYSYSLLYKSFIFSTIMGLCSALLLTALAYPLSLAQGQPQGFFGYIAIAPSLIFVPLIALLKGWFNGRLNMKPSALTAVIEQGAKLAFGIAFLLLIKGENLYERSAMALFAITLAELVALIPLVIYYFSKEGTLKPPPLKIKNRDIVKISAPIVVGGLIFPFVSFIDSLIIVPLLKLKGIGQSSALSSYGLLTGAVGSIVSCPVVLTVAMTAVIIPVIAKKMKEREIKGLRQEGFLAMKASLFLSLPLSLGLICLAKPLTVLLYPSLPIQLKEETALLLQISSAGIPLLAMLQIYNSMLQAVGQSKSATKSLLIGGSVKLIATLILIPTVGIWGGAVANLLCYGVGLLFSVIFYSKFTGSYKSLVKNLAEITLSGGIMTLAVAVIDYIVENIYLSIGLSLLFGGCVYLASALLLKVFSKTELMLLPFSKITLKISGYKEDI